MKKENKTKEKIKDVEEPCCADSDNCSIDCCSISKKKEPKCSCGGCC
ncbi:MAG TPA: hypothetical protein VJ438_01370 [Candidatus Nanoarchaeia archaeon]|nr:hypothetical protein [Candidatus Nanoarchaeia archaeon]